MPVEATVVPFEATPEIWGFGLVALRWWALLQVQVLWRATVGRVWIVVAAGLALVLALGGLPGSGVVTELAVDPWIAVVAELALGTTIGLVVALPGHALSGAAQASARVLGTAPGPWRALTLSLVAATALGLGLHRPLLIAMGGLLEVWPVGDPLAWGSEVQLVAIAQIAHATTLLALTLATPALLAGAMGELVIRVVGSGPVVAGELAQAAAPWVRVVAALVATGASWAAYDAIWAARALGLPG